MNIWTIVAIWRKNMLGYLSTDIICSEKRTVFREQSSRKTVSYKEQIMSKDKCPSIFSPQMATIVFIILQIFFAMRAVLNIGEYSQIFPSFSWGIFGHVTRLDQSRISKKIWWIIILHIQHYIVTMFFLSLRGEKYDFWPQQNSTKKEEKATACQRNGRREEIHIEHKVYFVS